MGQIFSLRKNPPTRSRANDKKLRKYPGSAKPIVLIGDYKLERVPSKISSEHSERQKKIRGSVDLIGNLVDANNNYTDHNHKDNKSSSNRQLNCVRRKSVDGVEGVLAKSSDNTYSNGGYNHSSSLPKSQPLKKRNYFEGTSKSLYSEPTLQSEPAGRHRHHRRRRSRSTSQHQHFGYDINNVEDFLTKCSLLSPANIPVVLSNASTLYQTRPGFQLEISLPLGMVVNGVFKIQQWIYVQTPHAEEGYIAYDSCLPLGILPTTRLPSNRSKTERCWETTEDVYRKPGLWTDSEQECLGVGRTARSEGARTPNCSEKNVDTLYLKAAASHPKLDRIYSQVIKRKDSDEAKIIPPRSPSPLVRETLLAVQMNYKSSAVSVRKGDVVTLLACKEIRDNHSRTPRQWFYIRTRNGIEAFIPAEVAGHGFL